jgi:hypothetical protein
MPELEAHTRLSRAPEVLFSPLAEGEGVLLSMEVGLYFSLNRSAMVVWETLERESSLEQLAQALCDRFKVSPEQAQSDLAVLLSDMIERKLVRVSS